MKKALSLLMTIVLVLGCFSAALAEKYPEGTLYKGMKGHTAEIKQLQQWLIDLEYLDDKADGKFGQNTQAAVKAFQKDRGLTADGIAWPETLELVEIYTNEPLVEYPEGTLHKGIYGHTFDAAEKLGMAIVNCTRGNSDQPPVEGLPEEMMMDRWADEFAPEQSEQEKETYGYLGLVPRSFGNPNR